MQANRCWTCWKQTGIQFICVIEIGGNASTVHLKKYLRSTASWNRNFSWGDFYYLLHFCLFCYCFCFFFVYIVSAVLSLKGLQIIKMLVKELWLEREFWHLILILKGIRGVKLRTLSLKCPYALYYSINCLYKSHG